MSTLLTISLTPAAYRWLATTTAARVLDTSDRACNLINQDQAILSLVAASRDLTPFALVVASDARVSFQLIMPEAEVKIEPGRLLVGPLQINFESTILWDPMPDWPAVRRLFTEAPARLADLATMALALAPSHSLLDLYPPQSQSPGGLVERRPPYPSLGEDRSALLERAQRGATELVQGLQAGATERCIAGAKLLVGLGPGLTPAGDDFMGGILLAAWAGLYGEAREPLGRAIVEAIAPLTAPLSAAYLRAAVEGECIVNWHRLFAALFGLDPEVSLMAIKSLISIGHTSGADALAGFIAIHYFTAHT